DALWGEFAGEAFGEADDGSLAGGVVGVVSLAALAGGGADEDDVAGGVVGFGVRLAEHLRDGGLGEAEDAVEVDGEGGSPLGFGHGADGRVFGRPDAVVGDEDVDSAEGFYSFSDKGAALFGRRELLLNGEAVGAEFFGQTFGCIAGAAVVEGDAGSGLMKEAHGGGSYAARASGDEGDFAFKGKRDHGLTLLEEWR